MENVYQTFIERGYLKQVTHDGLEEMLLREPVTFYIGYDPTADSLHVGHFVQLMAMAHMQRAGHRPIVLIGGGTTMVGDPSGRTDMRSMMTKETIAQNVEKFRTQISKFLDFSDGKALMVNNADWLLHLNYIDFLREVGVCFSVNRMLSADCYKSRMERGLNFLEFNYMLMQSYDFLMLYKQYGCKLEMGGDDQWSNILAGADLIRRKEQGEAFGMTFSLLLTSEGIKMGKTAKGALWLDPEKTSPYEFYQYWINVADADVANCMRLLTFLPVEQINELTAHMDERMNEAKRVLAYEVTRQVHGEDEAKRAEAATAALFGGGGNAADMPSTQIDKGSLADGPKLIDIMVAAGLTKSRGEGRRLIAGGGVYVDDEKVTDEFAEADKPEFVIRKGKKVYHKIVLK